MPIVKKVIFFPADATPGQTALTWYLISLRYPAGSINSGNSKSEF